MKGLRVKEWEKTKRERKERKKGRVIFNRCLYICIYRC